MFKLTKHNKITIQKGGVLDDMVIGDMFNVTDHNKVALNINSIDDLSNINDDKLSAYCKYAQKLLVNSIFNKKIEELVEGVWKTDSSISKKSLILLNFFVDAELTILLSKLIYILNRGETSFPSKFNCEYNDDETINSNCEKLIFRDQNFSDVNRDISSLSYDDNLAQDSIYGLFTMLNVKSSISNRIYYHSSVTRTLVDLLTTDKRYLVLKNKGLTFYYITQSKLNFLVSHFEMSDEESDKTNEKSYDFNSIKHSFIRALVYPVFDDHFYYYTNKLKITDGKLYDILTLFIRYRVEYIERLVISKYTDVKQDILSFKVFNSRVNNEYYYRYHNDNRHSGRKIKWLQKLNGELFDDPLDIGESNILQPIIDDITVFKQRYVGVNISEEEINDELNKQKTTEPTIQETVLAISSVAQGITKPGLVASATGDGILVLPVPHLLPLPQSLPQSLPLPPNIYKNFPKALGVKPVAPVTPVTPVTPVVVPVTSVPATEQTPSDDVINIVTFNVNYNNNSTLNNFMEQLNVLSPTVIFLQKVNEIDKLDGYQKKYKFPKSYKDRNYKEYVGYLTNEDIYVKKEITAIPYLNSSNLTIASGYGFICEIKGIKIANLYLADGDSVEARENNKELLHKILNQKPDIVVSDFNTNLEDTQENSTNNNVINMLKDFKYTYATPNNHYDTNLEKYTNLRTKEVNDGIWYNPNTVELYGVNSLIFNHPDIQKVDDEFNISDHYPVFGSFKRKSTGITVQRTIEIEALAALATLAKILPGAITAELSKTILTALKTHPVEKIQQAPVLPIVPAKTLVLFVTPTDTISQAPPLYTHQLYNASSIPSLQRLLRSLSIEDPTKLNDRIIDQNGLNTLIIEISKKYPGSYAWIL